MRGVAILKTAIPPSIQGHEETAMFKLRSLPYAVLTVGLLAAGGASAQSMWSIDQREASQEQRIRAGIRDGSLTRSEAYRLQQNDNRIDRYEARAKSDGVVTHAERQRLDGMLDRQGRAIHNERTDGQRAYGHNGWGDRDGHGGWDHNRGNHYGWDNNRGNHYGWDNNRGNHNGWDQASAHRNGWGDNNRQGHGDMNRPDHSGFNGRGPGNGQTPVTTHTGWNGGTRGQPQATTSPTTPRTGTHTGWNGSGQGRPQQVQAPAPQTNTRPAPAFNNQPRMIQASAPAPRQAAPSYTPSSGGRSGGRR
jgi:hypothetical protein